MSKAMRLVEGSEDYISASEIANKVSKLGHELDRVYNGVKEIRGVVFMQGAMVFAADLFRAMQTDVIADTVRPKSYDGTRPGEFGLRYQPDGPLTGAHVLLVEDIRDKGSTLKRVAGLAIEQNPATLHVVTFLDKPEQRLPDTELFEADGVLSGFTVSNRFVVGYGLDVDGRYRDLPHISAVTTNGSGEYVPIVPKVH